MSVSTPRPPDLQQRMSDAQRRPGLARAWERMRDAMKRRRNSASSATVDAGNLDRLQQGLSATSISRTSTTSITPDLPTAADTTVATVAIAAADDDALSVSASAKASSMSPTSARPLTLAERFGQLTPDDGSSSESDDDADGPMLPYVCTPTGVDHSRAHAMFAKYGLTYEPRFTRTSDEPPSKIRRVQKVSRSQMRWTCHECGTAVGSERACLSCGHDRCGRCPRQLSRRADASSKKASTSTDLQDAAPMQPADPACADAGEQTACDTNDCECDDDDSSALRMTSLEEALSAPLEKDSSDVDDNDVAADADSASEAVLQALQRARRSQPRAGPDMILKPKTQIIRRICHECNTQILPPNRAACQACGHVRCTACPRYPPKPEKWPHGSPGDDKAPVDDAPSALPPVQRVYRKPRIRVRYICEHCRTTFMQRDNCEECGHGKCKDCIRIPPRRPAASPAPESPVPAVA